MELKKALPGVNRHKRENGRGIIAKYSKNRRQRARSIRQLIESHDSKIRFSQIAPLKIESPFETILNGITSYQNTIETVWTRR